MKLIDFNVNYCVWIKLTGVGRKELEKQGITPKEENAEGFTRWQMHEVMFYFGHLYSLGRDVPFETAIKIEVKE